MCIRDRSWARWTEVRGGAPLGTKSRDSSCWVEADLVAECLELADEVASPSVLVDLSFVEVRAEVHEACAGIGEQMPDDDEGGAGDRNKCTLATSATDETPEALTEEGVGLGCGGGAVSYTHLTLPTKRIV